MAGRSMRQLFQLRHAEIGFHVFVPAHRQRLHAARQPKIGSLLHWHLIPARKTVTMPLPTLPALSAARRQQLSLLLCRLSLALCWLYQGLVPKLLGPDAMELRLVQALVDDGAAAPWIARAGGVAELLFGLWLLLAHRPLWVRWALRLNLLAMVGLLLLTAILVPQALRGAFNPVAMNLAMATLSLVGLLQLAPTHERN